jgi:hypothetical protein
LNPPEDELDPTDLEWSPASHASRWEKGVLKRTLNDALLEAADSNGWRNVGGGKIEDFCGNPDSDESGVQMHCGMRYVHFET